MIKFVKPVNEYEPEIGDFLADTSYYFNKFDINDVKIMHPWLLSFLALNTFKGLKNIINKDDLDLLLQDTYLCPYTNMKFFRVVPDFIMCNNIKDYEEYFPKFYRDMLINKKWSTNMIINEKDSVYVNKPNKIQTALLGPGYDIGCLTTDGSNKIVSVVINLSNKDKLVCWTHEWYNK